MNEKELLNQSESEYMSDAQITFFRDRLLETMSRLQGQAEAGTMKSEESHAADEADRASAEEGHWLALSMRERENQMIIQIKLALKRIKEGDYGFCEDTGEPIGIPRLLANPLATCSVEAMSRRELKEKQMGMHRVA